MCRRAAFSNAKRGSLRAIFCDKSVRAASAKCFRAAVRHAGTVPVFCRAFLSCSRQYCAAIFLRNDNRKELVCIQPYIVPNVRRCSTRSSGRNTSSESSNIRSQAARSATRICSAAHAGRVRRRPRASLPRASTVWTKTHRDGRAASAQTAARSARGPLWT